MRVEKESHNFQTKDTDYVIKEPFSKELYFGIFRSHEFITMPNMDFCAFCGHSRLIHSEYENKEEIVKLKEDLKRAPK